MSNKAEFKEDVGQAVLGNVNEAPRLHNSNILQLNVGNEDKPKPLGITGLQRKWIADKVKKVTARGNVKALDVYGTILTEFGAETIAELPRSRFKDAMVLLDGWIADLEDDQPLPSGEPASEQVSQHVSEPAEIKCYECEYHARQTKHARVMMIVQTIVMLLVVGWLLWRTPAAASIPVPAVVETNCHLEGKRYSIGSTARMLNGVTRECTQSSGNAAPYWNAIQAKKRVR